MGTSAKPDERRSIRQRQRQDMHRDLQEKRRAREATMVSGARRSTGEEEAGRPSMMEDQTTSTPDLTPRPKQYDPHWNGSLQSAVFRPDWTVDVYAGTTDDVDDDGPPESPVDPDVFGGPWSTTVVPSSRYGDARSLSQLLKAVPSSWSELSLVSSSSSSSSSEPDSPPPTPKRKDKLSAADFPLPPDRTRRSRSSSLAGVVGLKHPLTVTSAPPLPTSPTPAPRNRTVTPQGPKKDLLSRRRPPQAPPPNAPLPPLPSSASPRLVPLPPLLPRSLHIEPAPFVSPHLATQPGSSSPSKRGSSIPVSPDFDPTKPPNIPLPPLPPGSPYLDRASALGSGPGSPWLSPNWRVNSLAPPKQVAEEPVSPKTEPAVFQKAKRAPPPIDSSLFASKPLPPLPDQTPDSPPKQSPPPPQRQRQGIDGSPSSDPDPLDEEDETRLWTETDPSSASTVASSVDDLSLPLKSEDSIPEMPFAATKGKRTTASFGATKASGDQNGDPEDGIFDDADAYREAMVADETLGTAGIALEADDHASGSDSELDLEESLDGMAVRLGYRAPSDESAEESDEGERAVTEAFGLEEDVDGSEDVEEAMTPEAVGLGLGLRWSTMMRSAPAGIIPHETEKPKGDDLMSSTMSYRGSVRPSPRTSKYSPIMIDEPSSSDEEDFDMTLDVPSRRNSGNAGPLHLAPPTSPLTTPRPRASMHSLSSSAGSMAPPTPLFEPIKHKTSSATLSSDGMLSPIVGFKHPPGLPGSAERRSWMAARSNRVSSASAPEATAPKVPGHTDVNAAPRRSSDGDRLHSPPSSPPAPPPPPATGSLRKPSQSRLRQPLASRRSPPARHMADPLAETAMPFAAAAEALSPTVSSAIPKPALNTPSQTRAMRSPSPASSTTSKTSRASSATKAPILKSKASKAQILKIDTTVPAIPTKSTASIPKSSIPARPLRYKPSVASLASNQSGTASPTPSKSSPQIELRSTKLRPLILPTGSPPPTGLKKFGAPKTVGRVTSSPSLSSLNQKQSTDTARGATSPQIPKPKSVTGRFSSPTGTSPRPGRFGFSYRAVATVESTPSKRNPDGPSVISDVDELGRIVEVVSRAPAVPAPRLVGPSSLPISRRR